MVAGAFPLVKLGSLLIKQFSKPVSRRIKTTALSSSFFRYYVVMPPAQFYHWAEIRLRMWTLGMKADKVKPLNADMALELGAEMLGEAFVILVGVGTLSYEYYRSVKNEQAKENKQNDNILDLEKAVIDLQNTVQLQSEEIKLLSAILIKQSTNFTDTKPKKKG